jgi:bifunctional non-homologous end joining protein LigD
MPLTWSAVKSGLDPKRYNLRSAQRLLAAGSAWKDYSAGARPLRDAMDRLARQKN